MLIRKRAKNAEVTCPKWRRQNRNAGYSRLERANLSSMSYPVPRTFSTSCTESDDVLEKRRRVIAHYMTQTRPSLVPSPSTTPRAGHETRLDHV